MSGVEAQPMNKQPALVAQGRGPSTPASAVNSLPPEIIMLVGRFGGAALHLMSIAVAARLAGIEAYGIYSLCLAIVALAVTGCFTWNRFAYCRNFYLAQKANQLPALSSFVSKSFVGCFVVAAGIAYLAFATLVEAAPSGAFALTLLMVGAKASFDLQIDGERIAERFVSSAWRSLARPLIFLSCVLLGARWGVNGLLLALSLAFLLPSIGPMRRLLASGFSNTQAVPEYATAPMLSLWLPLSVGLVLDVVNHNSTRFYVNHFHGVETSGHYSIASDLMRQGLGALFLVIGSLQIQRLQRREASNTLQRNSIARFLNVTLLFGVAAAVLFCAITPVLFKVLFPETYQSGGIVFLGLVVGGAIICAIKIYFLDALLTLFNRQVDIFRGAACTLLISQSMNLLLIPHWGLNGAACAMLVAYSAGALFVFWCVLKEKPRFEARGASANASSQSA